MTMYICTKLALEAYIPKNTYILINISSTKLLGLVLQHSKEGLIY